MTLNGRTVRLPSVRCSPEDDVIRLDGTTLRPKVLRYLVLHKPAGVVTTRSDERGRPTVYGLLGDVGTWLFPVGRLDRETSGLILMTNDNRLGEALTNPASMVWKTYEAEFAHPVGDDVVRMLRGPMVVDGERYLPARVRRLSATRLEIQIHEGKNRQVRRMCEAAGAPLTRLARTRIGGLRLGALPPGRWKELSQKELHRHLWPAS